MSFLRETTEGRRLAFSNDDGTSEETGLKPLPKSNLILREKTRPTLTAFVKTAIDRGLCFHLMLPA
jgi:hypothetical protein